MEAFADRWVMYAGLAMITFTLLGAVLSMQSIPPPDADAAANTIDDAAGRGGGTHLEHEHNAKEVRAGAKRFGLRNEGGENHESIAFGTMVPVTVGDTHYEKLGKVLAGEQWQDVFDDKQAFLDRTDAATADAEGNEQWSEASGTLRVTTVVIDGERTIIVGF
ncbi:DUF7283 family protein [Haloarcula salinisoli]|uniref:Uncharacterized protein n=1 Tax=Haloarcula salinisoli TaxID=2487746 RepID=A0A8J8CAE4_9EURY|nr:hypothetical protein [Halomicroarcula salinisoli]MBX0288072.1 hypothetical protein [Halomicroarcula salinisoli]MBX0305204.1 hypothetical protein [Halomicroarcula salinisoli]